MRVEIANDLSWALPIAGRYLEVEADKQKYKNEKGVTFRNIGPCETFNCHGLTFASRRTGIIASDEIYRILDDDEYEEKSLKEVLPGDIVIYKSDEYIRGDIEHSGIVVQLLDRLEGGVSQHPLVLSKWGRGDEVIHPARVGPWGDCYISYWRKMGWNNGKVSA